MTECMKKAYTSGFCITFNAIGKLHDKLDRLRVSREYRIKELKEIPKQRAEIKRKAKRLLIQSEIYRLKGFDRRKRSYERQSWAMTKTLKKETRYRKMKEIHNRNRRIREVKAKIQELEVNQITRGETIKELLFQAFLKSCS